MTKISFRCPVCGNPHEWLEIVETKTESGIDKFRIIGGIGIGDFVKKFFNLLSGIGHGEWIEFEEKVKK